MVYSSNGNGKIHHKSDIFREIIQLLCYVYVRTLCTKKFFLRYGTNNLKKFFLRYGTDKLEKIIFMLWH